MLKTPAAQPPQCYCTIGGPQTQDPNANGNDAAGNDTFGFDDGVNGNGSDTSISSGSDVNASTGIDSVASVGLASDNFGGFGQSLSLSSAAQFGTPGVGGAGSIGANQPYLSQLSPGTLVLTYGAGLSSWFDGSDAGGWTERFFGQDRLAHTTNGSGQPVYQLTDDLGGIYTFADFSTSWSSALQGVVQSYTGPDGNATTYGYNSTTGQLTAVTQSDGTNTETWNYNYYAGSYNSGLLQSVSLTPPGSSVPSLQVVYRYYDGTGLGGNSGDLQASFAEIGGPSAPAVSLSSGGSLPVGTPQFYVVTAVTPSGETNASAEAAITPATGSQSVALSWPSFPNATSYNVYRSTQSQGEVLLASGITGTTYTDQGTGALGTAVPPLNYTSAMVYRYWRGSETDGTGTLQPTGSVKYVFDTNSFARAMAAGIDPRTAGDAAVAPYASKAFTYYNDPANHLEDVGKVASETIQGQGTDTFTYASSTNAPGYNAWSYEGVQTMPGGSTSTVYSNYAGQPVLKVFTDVATGNQYEMFFKYDPSGRLLWTAQPSAITGYSESYPDLVNDGGGVNSYLSQNSGLIQGTDYYASTSATSTTPGGVAGYLQDTYVQQGEAGAKTVRESKDYISQTATGANGGATVYEVADDTNYGGAAGADPRTTRYQSNFAPGTTQLLSQTTVLPPITAAQNGPASTTGDTADADTAIEVFDQFGRVTWQKDAGGYIQFTQYDPATGAVIKQINDVNTNDASDFSGLPSGWVTPAGGGLELITRHVVDQSGRTIAETDPAGNVTYTVYNDANHETLVYSGWRSITGRATSAGTTTTLIDTLLGGAGADYVGETLLVTAGTDAGQSTAVTAYNAVTHTLTLASAFAAATDATTQFVLAGGTGPTEVTRTYLPAANAPAGEQTDYNETLTTSAAPTIDAGGQPTGQEAITTANIQSLSRDLTNAAGQVYESDAYSSLAGLTYSTADAILVGAVAGGNTSAGNYSATKYGYDAQGRQDHVVDPNGTITDTTLDGFGRVTRTSAGTNDTTANNMVDVEDKQYDNGGVGDGNLTETVQHPGGGAADRATLNLYDWRDRLIASKQGALLDSTGNPNPAGETDAAHRLITATSYDNLDDAVATATYAGDGVTLGDFATWMPSADASLLRAYSTQSYDDQGRVYVAQTYSVDPTTGAMGASLATNYFFDHRGNLIEEADPGGAVIKHQFDGAGRDIKDSTSDGGVINNAAQNWANAGTTVNDVVLEQVLSTYDGDNNLTEQVDRQRFDSDPAINTQFTTATGDLQGPSGADRPSRDYYTAYYYDAADRLTDSVSVGTNGGVVWARPTSVPADSDTVLVTHTDYNAAGYVADAIDPRGIKAGTFYDLLGRKVETIAAWDGSANPIPTSDANQITTYTFDGNNDMLTMTAVMPAGTPSQTTAYLYGVGGTAGVNLFSDDLLAKVEYPDATTGQASTAVTDDQTFSYDKLGEKTSFTDQNGTTHQYHFDVLARLTADVVTVVGSGVDGTIRGLGYSFNDAGLPFQQTSYYDTSLANVANQVQDAYNGYGQLTAEYQNNAAAVNTATTPAVLYGYSQPTGANYSRQVSLTYPSGRVVDYEYSDTSGIDNAISRLSEMSDPNGTNIEAYSYLGLDAIVRKIRPGSVLTLVKAYGAANGDAGDIYTGLDRFGRVANQQWVTSDTPNGASGDTLGTTTEQFQYGYDQDSNVLYRNNLVNSSFSELYHANGASEVTAYDPLNRLTSFSRGTLSASGSTLDTVTDPAATNSWSLDPLGNSTDTGGVAQTFNSKNQIATYNGQAGIQYDHNGNMTQDPNGDLFSYDAWNRLTWDYVANSPVDQSDHGENFTYDADGRRPGLTICNGTNNITNSYYSIQGQDLEDDATTQLPDTCPPSASTTVSTYVWSESYVNDLAERDQSVNGGPVSRVYAQQDANHDVTSLVDSSGNVLERFAYDPYGGRTVLTPSWTPSSGDPGWLYGFQGGRLDPATGFVHFGDRDLNTMLGIWMQQDPAGYADSVDLYSFERNRPTNELDPLGLFSVNLQFNAFIPLSHGFSHFDGKDFNWFMGPFQVTWNRSDLMQYDWYETDNREKPGEKGTSRLRTSVSFDSGDIGNLSGGWFGADKITYQGAADPSFKMVATELPNGYPGTSFGVQAMTPKVESHVSVTDVNCDASTIEVEASDSDPFIPVAPNLNMDVTWTVRRKINGSVTVTAKGSHSKYPSYEGIANGNLMYWYIPTDTSPSLINLGPLGWMNFGPVGPITLT